MARPKTYKVSVAHRAVLPVASATVWGCIRDFNAMPSWNPSVVRSHIEGGPADRIGCFRVLDFAAGGIWTHQLTGLSDEDMVLQYRIVDDPQANTGFIHAYRAKMQVRQLKPMAQSGCELIWQAWFQSDDPEAAKARATHVFEAGFKGIRTLLQPPTL